MAAAPSSLGNVTLCKSYTGTAAVFDHPRGVTVSDEGEIFVADNMNERIQVFTLQGTFVREFPTNVPNRADKLRPQDVALDGEGNLWVVGINVVETTYCDVKGKHVVENTYIDALAVQYNKQGTKVQKCFTRQETRWPSGVAVDTRPGRNHILITRAGNQHHGAILVFRPDETLVGTVTGPQLGMKHPGFLTVDGDGNILVSDCDHHCINVWKEDGEFLFQFGGLGSGDGQLHQPQGICTDSAGNIIVADTGNRRVEMFDKKGKFLKHITTEVKAPCGIAMAPQGHLVVTDEGENTVSIFQNF